MSGPAVPVLAGRRAVVTGAARTAEHIGGVQHVAPIEEFEPERFAAVLRLMLEAPFLLARAVLPARYARGWALVERQPADQARVHGCAVDEVVSTVLLERSAVKRLVELDEVAAAVAHLCSPDAASITGSRVVLDGGCSAA